jgi:hypothetical protein
MNSFESFMFCACLVLAVASTGCSDHSKPAGTKSFVPADLRPITKTDERFQSYNVEMVEVTGGRFWKPYKDIAGLLKSPGCCKAQFGERQRCPGRHGSGTLPATSANRSFQSRNS